MISKEEVKHIAVLARLDIGEEELEKMQKELSVILDYMEELKSLDTSNIEPGFFSNILKNVDRSDTPCERDLEETIKLIKAAPETEDNYIKVKSILKRE